MESRIKERFNEDILNQAMKRYAADRGQMEERDGFESFIYQFCRDSKEYILRLSHSLRRSENLIRGEVDWINYLAENGVTVAGAIMSQNGKLVEAINDGHGGHFLATAFVKIDGRQAGEVGWSPKLYQTYGRLLGKMHALTKDYQPKDPLARRPQWEDSANTECVKHLPESLVRKRYWAVMDQVAALPRDRDSFGLIHYDAHGSNMLVDKDGNICLFDFDDSLHSWFVCDIAIVLFYMTVGKEQDNASVEEFMTHFLAGYAKENRLDPKWLKEIPHFLKIREIDLYAVIHRSFDVNNITDSWVAGFMKGRKERIERDVPFLDYDFASLSHLMTSPSPNLLGEGRGEVPNNRYQITNYQYTRHYAGSQIHPRKHRTGQRGLGQEGREGRPGPVPGAGRQTPDHPAGGGNPEIGSQQGLRRDRQVEERKVARGR